MRLFNKKLIIIPVHNEEQNVESVIDDIALHLTDFDVIFINDCSTDRTAEILKKRNMSIISSPLHLGYGGAMQLGFKYAVLKDYDLAVQFDADGQHLASEVKKMYDYFCESNNVDILIGSRFIKKAKITNVSFARMLGIRFCSFMLHLLFNKRIYDVTSGLQILSKKVFSYYASQLNYPEDYPDVDILAKMHCLKFTIEEFHVKMAKREYGKSMHSTLKPILYMFKVVLSITMVYMRNKKNIKL